MKTKVYINRGAPGSGKSYATSEFCRNAECNTAVFSTDKFFMVDGEYKFDPSKLGLYHSQCFHDFVEFMRKQSDDTEPSCIVFVDNTNINAWEIAPYVMVCNAYGVEYDIVTFAGEFQNTHGVPDMNVKKMREECRRETTNLPRHWCHRIYYP